MWYIACFELLSSNEVDGGMEPSIYNSLPWGGRAKNANGNRFPVSDGARHHQVRLAARLAEAESLGTASP